MTVGIAALCEDDEESKTVIAADRMVTVGSQGGIEYEDTESKLETFIENDELAAVAVGSGVSAYIDEIMYRADEYTEHYGALSTARDALQVALTAYQDTVKETIANQACQPYGYTLGDLQDEDVTVPTEIQRDIIESASNIKEDTSKRAQVLVAASGTDGGGIFHLAGMDYTNFSDIGYSVIGSGAGSARLTFIRREYDRTCEYRKAVLTTLEAKSQAEERQGVGRKVDMYSVSPGEIEEFGTDEKKEIRGRLDEIENEEDEARERVMEDWD